MPIAFLILALAALAGPAVILPPADPPARCAIAQAALPATALDRLFGALPPEASHAPRE